MKKILYILITVPLIFISCSKDWVDLKPTTQVLSNEAIKNILDADYAINGIYSTFQSNEYYGARMQYYADVTGDDMQATGTNKRSSAYYMMYTTPDNVYTSLWALPYRIMRNANNILSQIDGLSVTPTEAAQRDDLKGQALAVRALALFDVTRVYGATYTKDNGASLGACIVTQPVTPDYQPTRNTVAECYTQIISDLTTAIPLLKATKNDGKINRWAAKTLLSRVYLYKGDNANALTQAEEAITGAQANGYRLWTNAEYGSSSAAWKSRFTPEVLFEVINTISDRTGNEGIAYLMFRGGYNDIVLTSDFLTLLEEDSQDVRHSITKLETSSSSFNKTRKIYLLKYTGPDTDVRNANIPVLRLSEAYLNAAEAAVKTGNNAKAVTYLDAIVKRANPAKTVVGTTVTLERVIKERRKELVGEGHRQFDALRNNETIVRLGGWQISNLPAEVTTYNRDYFHAILPIPRYEIDANPNIKNQQNPGY
ncbi:MAG: RagB/SusD family nutrient uptake outer membrane protein [Bacteroidetes bacterium]|nr:RagB/SusD family nutrient uptake outer membrane protein [Bacteroidota bacterium]